MNNWLAILPILIPLVFWAAYHYHKDRHQPEPILNLVICFLLGIGAYFLGKLSYGALDTVGLRFDAYELAKTSYIQLILYSILAIGVIEESVKLIPFMLVALQFKAFDEELDGIIYASFIALGFAAAENIEYLKFIDHNGLIFRGFIGPVIHIVFASIWGYYVGVAFVERRPIALIALISVSVAAILHGIYDFVVIALPPTALVISAFLITAIWFWRLILIRRIKRAAGHSR